MWWWIGQHQAECTFSIIGLAIGFASGLDGWQGSPEGTALGKTFRVRNLFWVLGAFLTLSGRFLFDPTSITSLLLAYALSFVMGVALVVGSCTLMLATKYAYVRYRSPEKYPGESFSPVIDYLHYGYRHVKQSYDEGLKKLENKTKKEAEKKRKELLPEYGGQLSRSLAAVSNYLAHPSADRQKDLIEQILRSICAVMHLYKSEDGRGFNANCMVAFPKDSAPKKIIDKMKFGFGDASRYPTFLWLYAYANQNGAMTFSLPIEDPIEPEVENLILPGAPQAFLHNETTVISDSSKIQIARNIPKSIKDQIKAYFKARRTFKSFACLNIVYGGKQLGLVNIESSRNNIFGLNQTDKELFESLLFPFCLLIGFLISEGVTDV